jgi:hypothetical protein
LIDALAERGYKLDDPEDEPQQADRKSAPKDKPPPEDYELEPIAKGPPKVVKKPDSIPTLDLTTCEPEPPSDPSENSYDA